MCLATVHMANSRLGMHEKPMGQETENVHRQNNGSLTKATDDSQAEQAMVFASQTLTQGVAVMVLPRQGIHCHVIARHSDGPCSDTSGG